MAKQNTQKKRIAILASGNGSNAEAIFSHFKEHPIIEAALVLTNRSDAGVIMRAEKAGLPWQYISASDFKDEELVTGLLDAYEIDWVVLAGWLLLVPKYLVKSFEGRIINIHPALLPKYGGKGMYGHHVHEAVYAANEPESGITIHYVNEEFDSGKVIKQFRCAISKNDDVEVIEQKVRALELAHYPSVLEKVILSLE